MKSSQPQLSDRSRQKGLKVTSPGFNLATRVEMFVTGDSGMVIVAKKQQQRYSSLKESLNHTFLFSTVNNIN